MKVEDLKNTKIYLPNEADRIEFKNKIERLGIRWNFFSHCDPAKQYIPFIYIDETLGLYMNHIEDFGLFCAHKSKQIFLEDILAIEEHEEEHKFKPYDKVLVRDSDDGVWVPRFYSNRRRESISYPFAVTSGGAYKQCIPYEGNEQFVETTKSKD